MKYINLKQSVLKKIYIYTTLILITIIASLFSRYRSYMVFLQNKKLPIYSVNTEKKNISLTFDLSWGLDNTGKILDVLDQYQIKATFFVVGGWIDYSDDNVHLIKEIDKRGHEIGNHSNMHPDMTKISKERIIKEIEITDTKIKNITGKDCTLFRCPSGSYNSNVIATVESTKHYCIQWNVDSIDWKSQGADIEYNRIINNVSPGSILLFHNDAKYTPQNLPRIIENLTNKGYKFVKISDLIYKDNYFIDNDGKQNLKY